MNGALRSVLASIARRDRCTNLDSDSAPFSHESADLVRSLTDLRRTKGELHKKLLRGTRMTTETFVSRRRYIFERIGRSTCRSIVATVQFRVILLYLKNDSKLVNPVLRNALKRRRPRKSTQSIIACDTASWWADTGAWIAHMTADITNGLFLVRKVHRLGTKFERSKERLESEDRVYFLTLRFLDSQRETGRTAALPNS